MQKVTKKNALKAYKVFNSGWTCNGYQYEMGKEFKHDGMVSICNSGFHSCLSANDCFNYYTFDPKNKVAEVLIWGDIGQENEGNTKRCSSHIKLVREITWQEVLTLVNTGVGNTGRGNSGDSNSGNWNSGNWNSGNSNPGDCNPGDWNSGNSNSGDSNSGNWNSGNWNSGNSNPGDCNSGDWNSGDWNSGDWNSGNSNPGDWNSGNWNSGNSNPGDWNSGNWNSGNWNSGNWNACHFETGHFNTERTTSIRVFNKPCNIELWDNSIKPDFIFFNVVIWVESSSMTEEEKAAHPKHETTGGYLKTLSYKDAWRQSWNRAKARSDWDSECQLLFNLPNFNADVFKEISGIDPIKEK